MPWVVVKKNDQFCVYKEGADGKPTGSSLGCHPTEAAARNQQKALYASEARQHAEEFYTQLETKSFADIKLDTKYRERAAKSGVAMSDGSFPIPNCDYAMRAIRSIGRAPEGKRGSVRAHIRKRVKALGCRNVPDDWRKNMNDYGIIHAIPLKEFSEDVELIWVQAFPYKTYTHPIYGEEVLTREKAEQMASNFSAGVVGHDITTDFEHGLDSAKGKKGSGTIKQVEVRDDGLWLAVEPTSEAKKEIEDGAWKYFSVSYKDEWEHPESHEKFENVLWGGGLTNYPWFKGVAPLNFSDLAMEVADKEHAEPGTVGEDGEPIPRERESEPVRFYPQTDPLSDENNPEGSAEVNETELREWLGIGEDADIKETITTMKEDAKAFSDSKANERREKAFSEAYPEEARQLADLRDKNAKIAAKSFADSFKVVEREGRRYAVPQPILDKLEGVHKKFSEGAATVEDIQDVVSDLTTTNLPELGERGNGVERESEDAENMIKQFSDEVEKSIKESEGKLSRGDAIARVSREHPEWYEAYREAVPTRRN